MKENALATQARRYAAPISEHAETDDEGAVGERELRVMLAQRDAATARFRELKRRLLRRR
jgi:hypothetical protein